MESFKQSLQHDANLKEDNIMLARISTIDPAAKEVSYHSICRKRYQNEANTTPLAKKLESDRKRAKLDETNSTQVDVHETAFEDLKSFIQENVIEKKEVRHVPKVNSIYR